MAAFLPALAFGGKLLLGGATVGGTALAGASIYDAATGAGKGFRDQAYEDGPDPETGKFSAGLIGNQFIKEDSPEFAKGFKNYALNRNDTLRKMEGVLGDQFQFDSTKTIPQNIALNQNNFDRASVIKRGELTKLTPEYIDEQKRYADQLLQMSRDRADALNLQNQQFAITNKRLDNQFNLAQQQRADQLMMNADNLAFQREQLRLEDNRYNDKLDRQEAMDRERAFLALMQGGLQALGAAFA